MIELVIKNYLDGHLNVPSFFEHQNGIKGKYVQIEKIGGGKGNKLKSSVFAFQSYADSLFESAELNEQVKEVVEAMIEVPEISGIKLNSDYNFTDTQTKKYRYQAVYDINHY
ncbi:hypothetical protein [Streptococcus phage Str-PAP-1]|uniref:hypothetical protein n=1 Tax=Streptococcus phage Str-PAP-1 TaxID=1589270 RepID=UPI000588E0C0|nr:hypothetical protein AU157_gp27 [Streptococcus phage Str-PAP-1]AJD83095.1 hypothetical protein [Streptococcus phage Str-PAP-1]